MVLKTDCADGPVPDCGAQTSAVLNFENLATFGYRGETFYHNLERQPVVSLQILIERIWEFDCYRLGDISEADPVVMDVGAHLGVFSRFVLNRKPKARLIALEPDRENFSILHHNLSEYPDVSLLQRGLLDSGKELHFYTSREIDWRSTVLVNTNFLPRPEIAVGEYDSSYSIEVIDLDSLFSELNLPRLDLLKMTIPGEVEPLVLEGASRVIDEFRPLVSMSVYPVNRPKVEEYFEALGGYREMPVPFYAPGNLASFIPIERWQGGRKFGGGFTPVRNAGGDGDDWEPVDLMTEEIETVEVPFGLEILELEQPQVLLKKGSDWDEWGVRDPALLVDESGSTVIEEGKMALYFTGSCCDGRWQGVGRAISADDGATWRKSPAGPVLEPRPGYWDSRISSTAWVLRGDDGRYRMYYRGGSGAEQNAIGLALSDDGVNFRRKGERPILQAHDFAGIERFHRQVMGVIHVTQLLDSKFLMTFEAVAVRNGRGQIFSALSEDGENFHPFKDGYPLFCADQVTRWPVGCVCNPRIYPCRKTGIYMLTFNGHFSSQCYGIGLAFTRDFETWWEHPQNPILLPVGNPADHPFSGRLEGAVFRQEQLDSGEGDLDHGDSPGGAFPQEWGSRKGCCASAGEGGPIRFQNYCGDCR